MPPKKNNESIRTVAEEFDQESYARVARKAYELFEDRGRTPGGDVQDWLEAERLIKSENTSTLI